MAVPLRWRSMQKPENKVIVWVAILTLLGSLLASGLTAGIYAGSLSSRVTSLEDHTKDEVTREEWQVFRQDMTDRLDRIERKLDK